MATGGWDLLRRRPLRSDEANHFLQCVILSSSFLQFGDRDSITHNALQCHVAADVWQSIARAWQWQSRHCISNHIIQPTNVLHIKVKCRRSLSPLHEFAAAVGLLCFGGALEEKCQCAVVCAEGKVAPPQVAFEFLCPPDASKGFVLSCTVVPFGRLKCVASASYDNLPAPCSWERMAEIPTPDVSVDRWVGALGS